MTMRIFYTFVGFLIITASVYTNALPAAAQQLEPLFEVSSDPRCSAETVICPQKDKALDPNDTLLTERYRQERREEGWVSEIIDKCIERRAVVWRCEDLEVAAACEEWEWLKDAEDYLEDGSCLIQIADTGSASAPPSEERLSLLRTLVNLLTKLSLLLLQLQTQNL